MGRKRRGRVNESAILCLRRLNGGVVQITCKDSILLVNILSKPNDVKLIENLAAELGSAALSDVGCLTSGFSCFLIRVGKNETGWIADSVDYIETSGNPFQGKTLTSFAGGGVPEFCRRIGLDAVVNQGEEGFEEAFVRRYSVSFSAAVRSVKSPNDMVMGMKKTKLVELVMRAYLAVA